MKRSLLLELAAGALFVLAAVGACGSVTRPSFSSAGSPSSTPTVNAADAGQANGGSRAVSFVIKAGADPIAAGRRIAGPNATVEKAALPRPDNLQPPARLRLQRTFLVPVPSTQEQPALKLAQADPDIEGAQLVPWPPRPDSGY